MDVLSALFLLFATVALVGAAGVLIARNPVHSVLFMLLAFVNVAAMFVLLGAEFVAVVQVLVYSGAILVLFLFVVMLLQRAERPLPTLAQQIQLPAALLVGSLLAAELAVVALSGAAGLGRKGADTPDAIRAAGGNVEALGQQLYTTWILPFEIASLLLLIAAIGAIYLAKEDV